MIIASILSRVFFFFNDTATTEIYTLSLHDALPISYRSSCQDCRRPECGQGWTIAGQNAITTAKVPSPLPLAGRVRGRGDRKSTRLNSSHANISYAVFCLKKKKNTKNI